MGVRVRAFCHWLAKFWGGLKKTPDKDNFCDNDTPSLFTVDVSQDAQDSFCGDESCEFLKMSWLISIFGNIDHVDNAKNLMCR